MGPSGLRVEHLVARGFRNLAPLDLPVESASGTASFVVLHGPNAQGKTNALEAVHWVATLKPLRGRRLRELVQFGAAEAHVGVRVGGNATARTLAAELAAGARTVRLDGKVTTDLYEYFAALRAVAFVPSDGEIVSGEPARRRAWLDRAVFTQSPAHLDRVRAVRRLLDQKSAALRTRAERAVLDVLDTQLARAGGDLVEQRARLVADLAPHVETLHRTIAEGFGQLRLALKTEAEGDSAASRAEALARRLAEVRPRELERRTTLAGPQLDDLRVTIDDHPAREFASRGQIRSVVLAIKLAEMVAARARGVVPLFLLDDLSSELDARRTARVMELLLDLGAQVFVTTTDPAPLLAVLPRDRTLAVSVSGGVLARS